MQEDGLHCENCRYFFEITKEQAQSVCDAMPHVGKWNRWRAEVHWAVRYALGCHGVCGWRAEIRDTLAKPCAMFDIRE